MVETTIDAEACKGCALCVSVCPKHLLAMERSRLNQKGYHPAYLQDGAACVGCAMCAEICPDCAITIQKESV